jgi:CPA2 family monovalent cation:H+ antiporter-2
MFALGLEFSLRTLFAVIPTAGIIALLQTSAMVALGFLAGQSFGWTRLESIYAGGVIAISSTTIIVKAFAEQGITGRFTQIVFGVLIIEDLIGILMLAILTAVSAGGGVTPGALLGTTARLAAFLLALVVVGLLIVPRLVRAVVRLNLPEATVVTAVGICFAGAYLALTFGYSVALGAFLAGSLVAESGEAKTVEHQVQPVRDVFAAIFFVAVGMLIDPRLIAEHWMPVLVFTLLVIGGKVVAVSLGSFVAGYGVRTSVQAGMSLAQIGEFSFIIAGVGLASGATGEFLYPIAVAVSAITTLTTPWLIRSAAPVASFVDRRLPQPLQNFVALYGSWMAALRASKVGTTERSRDRRLRILLLGDFLLLTLIGTVTLVWSETATTWVSTTSGLTPSAAHNAVVIGGILAGLPFAAGFLRLSRAIGLSLAYRALPAPQSGRVDLAAAPRRAIVVTWQFALGSLIGIPLLAVTHSLLPPPMSVVVILLVLSLLGIALWRSATNLQLHTMAGAQVIVAALGRQMASEPEASETAETSVSDTGHHSLVHIFEMIPGLGEPVVFRVEDSHYATGKSLAQIDLRDATDATVLVIRRKGEPVVLPVGKEVLLAGDTLALAGTEEAVESAKELLANGPAPGGASR